MSLDRRLATQETVVTFKQITLPIRTLAIGGNHVDYIISGKNVIGIAIETWKNIASFDCTLQLIAATNGRTSRTFEYEYSYDHLNIGLDVFSHFIGEYIQTHNHDKCLPNYLQITFNNNRVEWISSVMIRLHQNKYHPKSFVVKAKNEIDTEWVILKNVTNLVWESNRLYNRIWLDNNNPYNMYRFEDISGDSITIIDDIDLFSDATATTIPLIYSPSSITIYKDVRITRVYPTSTFFTNFTTTPSFPNGLILDFDTGVISGIASDPVASSQDYTIHAKTRTGIDVSTVFHITVELCTGGKTFITCVIRSDNWIDYEGYRLYEERGIAGDAILDGQCTEYNSLNYIDICLDDGIYTFEFYSINNNGWYTPGGYHLAVDGDKFRFEMGYVYVPDSSSSASVTTSFSSYLPFQIGYNEWKVYNETIAVPGNWTSLDFDDSTWITLTSAEFSLYNATTITTYIRKIINIPNIEDYQVLNIRMKYSGGVVCYFNGHKVARFNLDSGFDFASLAQGYHDTSVDSKFHIILSTVGAVAGENVIAFEIHRPTGVFSGYNPVFDATGVFGVNECSIVLDSINYNTYFGNFTSKDDVQKLFDMNIETELSGYNYVNRYMQLRVENQEGTTFNNFAFSTSLAVMGVGFDLYGRYNINQDKWLVLLQTYDVSTVQRSRVGWDTSYGMVPSVELYWKITKKMLYNDAKISEIFLQYCVPTGENICLGDGVYPPAKNGTYSITKCENNQFGYRSRFCINGQLGAVHDRCDGNSTARLV